MRPEDLELFCANIECGNAVVHTGVLSHATTREHRRLQYTGIRQLSPEVVLHQYMCPVCSTKRLFGNNGAGFEEVSAELVAKMGKLAALTVFMGEVLKPTAQKDDAAKSGKRSWLDRLIK